MPWGYDFDYINSDIILNDLDYQDGKWVINRPGASSYRAIVLPDVGYMRPQVAERIEALKQKGGPILEAAPVTDEQLLNSGIKPASRGQRVPRWVPAFISTSRQRRNHGRRHPQWRTP